MNLNRSKNYKIELEKDFLMPRYPKIIVLALKSAHLIRAADLAITNASV